MAYDNRRQQQFRPPGPKYELTLLQLPGKGKKLQVRAVFMNGQVKVDNAEIAFILNGITIGTERTKNGEATIEIEFELFNGAKELKLKAQALGYNQWREIELKSAEKPEKEKEETDPGKKEPPDLVIEENKIADGHYRLRFGIYDSSGASVGGDLRLCGSIEFTLDADEVRGHKTITVPLDGVIKEVKFAAERLELDLDLPNWNRQYQLRLSGPQPKPPPAKPGDGALKHLFDGWK